MSQLQDLLQSALQDRYAIERELGRGGSGTVYLARDLRHDRLVALKVLRPEVSATLGAERFLHEIRIAARLQHPHVLPLHDSGEAAGFLYYVMPYVDGESLRDKLMRERQLPLKDALQITREVADALAYAHAQGFVHRDIKPANILLTADTATSGGGWHALVTDFGIARAVDEAHALPQTLTGAIVGTPVYMSPEQAGSGRVDGRSDVYSLACVLYEMLAGGPPFEDTSLHALIAAHLVSIAEPVSARRPSVPPHVEAALAKALAKAPDDRFPGTREFADALEAAPLSTPISDAFARATRAPLRRWRRWARWQRWGVAAALLASVATGFVLWPTRGIAYQPNEAILIADVENLTGDTVFDRSLTTALTAGIQQSSFVSVFPRTRVAQTVRRMQRPGADTLLDEALAREVALREGVRVVVTSSISRIADTYALTARLVDPDSGTDLRVVSVRARSRTEVIDALDQLARRVRRELGESLRSLRRQSVPLPRATTSSLDALKKFAEGNRAWNAGRRDEARELWLGALALDSNFALAHSALGGLYYWNNDRPSGERHFRRALELAGRLTERERLWVLSKAAAWRGNRDESIKQLRIYLSSFPDDRAGWFNLGYDLMRSGRHADALEAYARLLAMDSLHASAYINVAVSHMGLGQFDKAVAAYRRAFAIDSALLTQDNNNHEFGSALILAGHGREARQNFERMLSRDQNARARGLRSLGLLDMLEGRYAAAGQRLREAVVINRAVGAATSEVRNRLFLAVVYGEQGDSAALRQELGQVHRLFRSSYLEPGFLMYAGRLFARSGDLAHARELLDTLRRRVNAGNPSDQADLYQLGGEIELQAGRTDSAVALLQLAHGTQPSGYRLESLARGLERAGDTSTAIARYRDILGERDVGWEGQEGYTHAEYRIGRLLEGRGEAAAAMTAYERFLEGWRGGDRNLVSAADARARLDRLRRSQRVTLLPRNPGG